MTRYIVTQRPSNEGEKTTVSRHEDIDLAIRDMKALAFADVDGNQGAFSSKTGPYELTVCFGQGEYTIYEVEAA